MVFRFVGVLLLYLICYLQVIVFSSKTHQREAMVVKRVLDDYVVAFGRVINLQISEVTFSKNVVHNMKKRVKSTLGVSESNGGGKYLGFSACVGRSKKALFNFFKDKVWKKN